MLTAITIENFKGISEPVRLELRPITLLFGKNSAGKSSLLHALIYAREVFERHNLDADRTLAAGEHLDLGGFSTFVRNHDLKSAIRLRFELSLKDIDLPGSWDPELDAGFKDPEFLNLSWRTVSAEVGVTISWSRPDAKPFVSEYEVGINGRRFAESSAIRLERVCASWTSMHSTRYSLTCRNTESSAVPAVEPEPGSKVADDKERWEGFLGRSEQPEYFQNLLEDTRRWLTPVGEPGAIGLLDQQDALPDLERIQSRSNLPIVVQTAENDTLPDDDELTFYQFRPQLGRLSAFSST